jgi:methionine sulfoxide reductase heme-binding subunit
MSSQPLARHAQVGAFSLLVVAAFWFSRMEWSPEHRLWRAVGDASYLLLVLALISGPLARLWPATAWTLPWRREIGVWCGLLALTHTFVTLDGWIRWDLQRLFGYEFVPQLERYARLEPGFGLANAVGFVALFLTLILAATSSAWAVNLLGPSAWKWLQYGSYSVFYLAALHSFYFLFIHFTDSFHRGPAPAANWFQVPFLLITLAVPALQAAAFIRTVARRRRAERSALATESASAGRRSTGKQAPRA